jgi:hypothetical protein
MTTAGAVTDYTDPSIDQPSRITAGPNDALWFTNLYGGPAGNGSIGEITTSGPAIAGVTFTGDTAAPTVIISGYGFGTTAPAGASDDSTSCGSYTSNGEDYGATNLWFVDTGNFAAGSGTPPSGACIGLSVQSWSSDLVVYKFGNAYDSFAHWYISAGDQYTLSVLGAQDGGTVSFSG